MRDLAPHFRRLAVAADQAFGLAPCGEAQCLWRVPRDCSTVTLIRRFPPPASYDMQLAVDADAVYVSISSWQAPSPSTRIERLPKR